MCPTFCRSHVIELYPVIVGFTAGRTCQPILIVFAAKTASFLVVSISQMRVAGIPGNTNHDYSPDQLCLVFVLRCCHCVELNAICCTRPLHFEHRDRCSSRLLPPTSSDTPSCLTNSCCLSFAVNRMCGLRHK